MPELNTTKCVAALDFGSGGAVRIDALGVEKEEALSVASDLIAWIRLMRAKHEPPRHDIDGDWAE